VRYGVIDIGVTYIGEKAFFYSGSLQSVTVDAENPPIVGDSAFGDGNSLSSATLRVPNKSINKYLTASVWKNFGYINPSTVTYRTQNDIVADTATLVSYGKLATKPATDPTRSGFSFGGWYEDGETAPYDFNTPVTSDITLLAKWNSTTSVAFSDHAIPQGKPKNEVAAIAPVSTSASGFTAGPNPAPRSSGSVAFFRQGALIVSASLTVYDAAGNVVRALSIRDNAVGTQSKRRVGSWDLKDATGRLVPGGTYLVKGTITAAGGKSSQNVSLLVGVR
jgi:uncharacterized repeat protein (TIGR02543 family)